MLRNKIEEMKEEWKRQGILKRLSEEENYKINKMINDEMQIVRMDYRRREAQSIIDAGETYYNC